ncbi:hypothetical protein MBLNU230_g7301t1 [Neophaeotheca triangularis]
MGDSNNAPSDARRPPNPRLISINPALHEDNISVPVTPGIHDNPDPFNQRSPSPEASGDEQGSSYYTEYDNGYTGLSVRFSGRDPSSRDDDHRPDSPADAARGAQSPEDLLRRLSLTGERPKKPEIAETDPRSAHASLNLSGHVISATFCVPYKLGYKPGANWELQSRRGTSALFDSFSYLSSPESPWQHTLVGWTGEVEKAASSGVETTVNGSSMDAIPLNKASAPIPIDSHTKPKQPSDDAAELHITRDDRDALEAQLSRDHGGRVTPVWLHDEIDADKNVTLRNQQKWRRYGEHELFTLFHYKQNEPTDGRAIKKAWADYYRMNRAFADTIVSQYKPGDIVLIHDYHLLLLPSMLRQRLPNVYIGFFLHIPFPSSEYYRCLSRRKEILEGMLGANMIGFQSWSYARHFSSCCTRVLGFDSSSAGVDAYGAHVAVDVFPIGINAENTHKSAFNLEGIDKKMEGIRDMHAGKKIIVGRDRLDTVRGVAQKLQAFEIFLERHPEWHEKVILIQVTSPTSIEERDDKGDKTANKISDLVARINGTFGHLSYAPVQHYPQYLRQDEYFALLRVADLGLITSVRDGMNTTALEYVICQKDNHSPLIISEFSGTAGSLGHAIHINPWDLGGTADAIDMALVMSEDKKSQAHNKLYKHVTRNTIQSWTTNYLKRLLTNLVSFSQSAATPALDRVKLLSQYRASRRRLFMFDYDGTLTPIVKDPQAAVPSDRVIRTLKSLASDHRNAVWIISGRDQAFLDEWMGHIPELGLSAEHGSFIRMPHSTQWENLTEKIDMSWQQKVIDVFNWYSERTQGSFIERKKIALTWHYRRADPVFGAHQANDCQKHLNDTVAKEFDVEVMAGKANLEVRPRFVNKGEIAKKLVESYGQEVGQAPEFVLCLGDDFTDEDMFRSLSASALPDEHVFAVTVGASSKQTLASYHLLEPADVISTLALLNGSADAGDVGAQAVVEGVDS